MTFAHPQLLWLLPLALLAWLPPLLAKKRAASLPHPTLVALVAQGLPTGRLTRLRHLPHLLRMVAVILLLVALARPQQGIEAGVVESEGVDIVVALDISGSMAAQDFAPDRLTVALQVVDRFIASRKHDRVALVLFAHDAYTQVPLTLDHALLRQVLANVKIGLIEDGTAIGSALLTATRRLSDSSASSRLVVLLTDGDNNSGEIDPLTAADMAAKLGVRVYTIAVGQDEPFIQIQDSPLGGRRRVRMQTHVDEALLTDVADRTGGQFFRAKDADALASIYARIDQLERSTFEATPYLEYKDHYLWPLLLALALLLLEWGLAATRLRRVPG